MHVSLNNNDIMCALFLDISKAFDSLDHAISICKLSNIALSNNSVSWFRSYLDRMQYVRFNNAVSKPVKFVYGIPQGSCLGPTLYIFYINDFN